MSIPYLKNFHLRLKWAMKSLGVTQAQLAYYMGVGQGTVSGWQKDVVPHSGTLKALASALHCDPEWLVTGDGIPFAPENVRERVHRAFAAPKIDYRVAFEALVGGMSDAQIKVQIQKCLEAGKLEEAQALINYQAALRPKQKGKP